MSQGWGSAQLGPYTRQLALGADLPICTQATLVQGQAHGPAFQGPSCSRWGLHAWVGAEAWGAV